MSQAQMTFISDEISCESLKETQCANFKEYSTDHCNLPNRSNSPKSVIDVTKSVKPLSFKTDYGRSRTQGSVSFPPPLVLSDLPKVKRPPSHRRAKSMTSYQSIQDKNFFSNTNGASVEDELDNLFECIKLRKSLYGEDHPEVALIHNSIGNVHSKQEKLDEAMNSYEEALRIYRSDYGEYHPSVASTIQNIGNTHFRLGKEELALQCIKKALSIRENLYGNQHPDIAGTLQNLGQLYAYYEKHGQAMENLQRALEIRIRQQEQEPQYGSGYKSDNNINIARIMNAMGNIYVDTGNLEMALKLQREALKRKRAAFGITNASIAISLMDLGTIYKKLGDLDEGISLYKEALSIQQEYYNHRDHYIDFGVTLHLIGSLYRMKGEIAKARKTLMSASSYYKKASLTPSHRCVLTLKRDLESICSQ